MKLYLLLILTLFLTTVSASAQKNERKTIVTIETTIDENGNEVTTKTIKEVGDLDLESNEKKNANTTVITKKGNSKTVTITVDNDNTEKVSKTTKKEVTVAIEETDGIKKVSIKFTNEDGKIETINWEGDGDFPEDIKKELEKRDIHLDMLESESKEEVIISKDEQTSTVINADTEKNNDLLLNNININIESNAAGKTITLTFSGKSTSTSVSLTDETDKQVYHSFMKNFKGTFNEEINIKGATNEILELRIKQGRKEFVTLLK